MLCTTVGFQHHSFLRYVTPPKRVVAPFLTIAVQVKGEGDTHYYDRYPDSREGPIPLSDREDKMFEALGQF